jgi:hypothetical protein
MKTFPRLLTELLALSACVAALLLAGCAAPLQQTPPPGVSATIERPVARAGDTWIYQVRDLYTGIDRGQERWAVTRVAANRIEMVVDEPGVRNQHVYDEGWNWLQRPATNLPLFLYEPAYGALAFPLSAGRRWQSRTTAIEPGTGRRFPVWIAGSVLGWERIKVPAGEFDALKVQREVYIEYHVPTVRGRSEIVEQDWYAPGIAQPVRREIRSQYLSHLHSDEEGGPRFIPDDWLAFELVRREPGKTP